MASKNQSATPSLPIVLSTISIVGLILLTGVVWHRPYGRTMMPVESPQPAQDAIVSAHFTCDAGKTIQASFLHNNVELTLSDKRNFLLTQGISASGTRYTNNDESVTFWNKGNTAFIEEGANNEFTYNNCNQTAQ